MKILEEFNELLFTAKDNLYNSSELTKEEVEQYFDSRTKNIKIGLEILELIIKWKNNFNLKYNFDYLDKEELIVMKSEVKLIENYLSHFFGYIPKCFKQDKGVD